MQFAAFAKLLFAVTPKQGIVERRTADQLAERFRVPDNVPAVGTLVPVPLMSSEVSVSVVGPAESRYTVELTCQPSNNCPGDFLDGR